MQVKSLFQEKSHSWKCLLLQQECDECYIHAVLPWGMSHEFSLSWTPEYFSTLLSKTYKNLLIIWCKLIKLKSRLTALIHFHLAFTGVYFFSSYLLNLETPYAMSICLCKCLRLLSFKVVKADVDVQDSILTHLPWPLAVAGSVEIGMPLALVGITWSVAPLVLATHNPGRKEVIQGEQ